MINPVMLEMSEEKELGTEGCLSVPDMMGDVERSVWIKMEATDINGERKTYEFEGFDARVMQHEYDHLEAHVFTDRISPIRRQFCKSKLTNIAKGKVGARYKYKR